MRRKLLLALALVLCASVTHAGTVTRGIKAGSGTTAFVDGVAASAAEVNTDFDTLYSEINGQLDDANIASDAAIVLTKVAQTAAGLDADIVDDYSATEGEQATVSDPGTSEATTLATNLQIELAQIRFKLEELTVGRSATLVASSTGTDTDASWIDGPHRPGNLIYNGGFNVLDTLATGADGDGWTRVETPTTLEVIALVESEGNGDGNALRVIDTADANSGVEQVLDGLKASVVYELIALVQDDVGTCSVGTSGADTDITIVSDDGGTWQVLAGTFETDSTPTDVDIELLAVTANDDCSFKFVGVYEINTDPLPRGGKVHCYDSITTATEDHFASGTFTDAGVTCAVTVPAPGYMITVRGRISAESGSAASMSFHARLRENCGAAATKDGTTESVEAENSGGSSEADIVTADLFWVNDAPAAGTTCTYTLEGMGDNDAFHRNEFGADVDSDVVPITWVDVIMEPTG